METDQKIEEIMDAADEAKAMRINALDLRGKTIIADHFVICSGTSDTHVRAIAERIQDRMSKQGEKTLRVEGVPTALWILLDYGDIVVHVMREEQRNFYDLESLWEYAPSLQNARDVAKREAAKS